MGVERVRWADDASSSRILQDVCVDHGGLHILVSEEFLDCPDVVAGHQQMSREGVAKGVAADLFGDSTSADGGVDRFSHHRLVKVVAANGIGSGIGAP